MQFSKTTCHGTLKVFSYITNLIFSFVFQVNKKYDVKKKFNKQRNLFHNIFFEISENVSLKISENVSLKI